jgi:GPI ethanolamine phosphate transferase 3 subunit O
MGLPHRPYVLGVSREGHRLRPDHPTVLAKQKEMNDILKRVVDALDKDTLLVVLEDQGIDREGDHDGDHDHEVSPTPHLPH